jgi:hypothetical protein
LKPGVWFRRRRLVMISPDSLGTACPPSGRNSTYRPVQISGASSVKAPLTHHWRSEPTLCAIRRHPRAAAERAPKRPTQPGASSPLSDRACRTVGETAVHRELAPATCHTRTTRIHRSLRFTGDRRRLTEFHRRPCVERGQLGRHALPRALVRSFRARSMYPDFPRLIAWRISPVQSPSFARARRH